MKRLWSKIAKSTADTCWDWTGGTNSQGYGWLRVGSRKDNTRTMVLAHRLVYMLQVGDVGTLDVLHTCDNPLCCNPAHLFLGTHQDNMADKAKKLRTGVAKLTPELVRQIRARYAEGGVTQTQLAKEYGVVQSVIGKVVRRETWRHVKELG